MAWIGFLSLLVSLTPEVSTASESTFVGPGRFCGYSPIIDLREGEKITPTHLGMHSGSFVWQGEFGSLDVNGIGWAAKPKGKMSEAKTAYGHFKFEQRRMDGAFVVAIWNGQHGVAYLKSPKRLTPAQLAAVERVNLFNEGDTPEGCKFLTMFFSDEG